jgi:hypothetical protein
VLVTSLPYEMLSVTQLYRDRAEVENPFDELKNQWSWAGFTTHDLMKAKMRVLLESCNLALRWIVRGLAVQIVTHAISKTTIVMPLP